LSQTLRFGAFVQIRAGEQHTADSSLTGAGNHIIPVFGELRAGQVYANIKHANPHMTTALTGGC
jgi:hypothetical protein